MPNSSLPKRNIGILAHVDAGKTTLSEAILYLTGAVRRMGRVDHRDAFLDTDVQERERGITIFSKQAEFSHGGYDFTLLDTPGHVDFSGETERALSVMDAAILVISGADGIQGHTRTLWRLLELHRVPVFLFVNKMDQAGTDREALLRELRERLSDRCVDILAPAWEEQAAGESEEALEEYLESGSLSDNAVRELVQRRQIFPCYFGSALKTEGVEPLLNGLARYLPAKAYPDDFGARVYKITHDRDNTRLTWLKVTGGGLCVRETVSCSDRQGNRKEEKINQLRIYSGGRFTPVEEVSAGTICAVAGLSVPAAGDGLGFESSRFACTLEPVFSYQVLYGDADPHTVLQKLRLLEEEDPGLHVTFRDSLREIRVQLMGDVQTEILQRLMADRFGMDISFGEGGILYRETITEKAEGVGHYEPLRHYAEVHLLLEPGEPGSGLVFASRCSTDQLDLNWQRLILTHLAEKEHRGVLIGAPITDMKITLTAGRAHLKHTEGGDFRQATYRAVRQGIMSTKSILLEPWYNVRLELPAANVGRAMTDIQKMGGDFDPPETVGEDVILNGYAPVAEMRSYYRDVIAYTRGKGRLSCSLRGYEPCRNQAELLAGSDYDPCRDVENTPDSVFCSHGAGFVVPWDKVPEYMHLDTTLPAENAPPAPLSPPPVPVKTSSGAALDKELQAIYERTYGKTKERSFAPRPPRSEPVEKPYHAKPLPAGPEYILVDGYNILFAWDALKKIAADNMDAARQILMDLLCNYRGIRGCEIVLVFDAYRVPFHKEEIIEYGNIHVVYTKEAETADAYIQKTCRDIASQRRVRVATSDTVEQLIILGQGAVRVSADAFRMELEQCSEEMRRTLREINTAAPSRIVAQAWEKARQEKKDNG